MQRTSLAKGLVVGALACFGILAGASLAQAQETKVQGTNGSSGAVGASGPVAVTNTGAALGGPSAGAFGGVAATQMDGDTAVNLDQTSVGASGPASAGSQVTTPAAGSKTQNTNVSTGAVSVSGPVAVGTAAVATAGPRATGIGGVATASQSGDDVVSASQVAAGFSGPADAGSQITVGGIGDALTQATNVSTGALAASGATVVFDLLTTQAGPTSTALLGGTAATGQVGDDDAVISQVVGGVSGAAAAGSQVVRNSTGTAQPFNHSTAAGALTGPVLAGNVLATAAGPSSLAAGPGFSGANHLGDAAVVGSQVNGAATGNAVVGSQLIGLSIEELGSLGVVNQQASDPDFFQPVLGQLGEQLGLAGAADLPAGLDSGTIADLIELLGSSELGDLTPDSGNGTNNASSVQAPNGDATTSQQVPDSNGEETNGFDELIDFLGQSEVAELLGPLAALLGVENVLADLLEPQAQDPAQADQGQQPQGESTTDAPSEQPSEASQDQPASGETDAATQERLGELADLLGVDPSDLEGLTGLGGVPSLGLGGGTVQNANVGAANLGATGSAVSLNAAAAAAGPASASVTAPAGAGITLPANAVAAQDGQALTIVDQDSASLSGNAMAGSQEVPSLSSPLARVADTNVSVGTLSASGLAASANIGGARSSPLAGAIASATAAPGSGALSGGATATAFQDGIAAAALVQDATGASGDAVSGSQVERVPGAITAALRLSNVNIATLGAALTGPGVGTNIGGINAGPVSGAASSATGAGTGTAVTGGAVSNVVQDGHDGGLIDQDVTGSSGDAAFGSQINDIAALGAIVGQRNTNVAAIGVGASGGAFGLNIEGANAGPAAGATSSVSASGTGTATAGRSTAVVGHDGHNRLLARQRTHASTGDAASASQVYDVVAAGGILSTADTNVSTGSFGVSGTSVGAALGSAQAGPAAASIASATAAATGTVTLGDALGSAAQSGDNTVLDGQLVLSTTGDALAGSQTTHAVIAAGSLTSGRANVTLGSLSASGSTVVVESMSSAAGPVALAAALGASTAGVASLGDAVSSALQRGDNLVVDAQVGLGATGDAISGSQVGVVGALAGIVGLGGFNGATGQVALTGSTLLLGIHPALAGPLAAALPTGAADAIAVAAQDGPNAALGLQLLGGFTGPAAAGSQIVAHAGGSAVYFPVGVTAGSVALTGPVLGLTAFPSIAGTLSGSVGGTAVVTQTGGNLALLILPGGGISGPALVGTLLAGNVEGFIYAFVAEFSDVFEQLGLPSVLEVVSLLLDLAGRLPELASAVPAATPATPPGGAMAA